MGRTQPKGKGKGTVHIIHNFLKKVLKKENLTKNLFADALSLQQINVSVESMSAGINV